MQAYSREAASGDNMKLFIFTLIWGAIFGVFSGLFAAGYALFIRGVFTGSFFKTLEGLSGNLALHWFARGR
mgnify:CR=1 FL=1